MGRHGGWLIRMFLAFLFSVCLAYIGRFTAWYISIHNILLAGQHGIKTIAIFFLLPMIVIQLAASRFSARTSPKRHEGKKIQRFPMAWTLFSRLFFTYTWRILVLGYRNRLELSSLDPLVENVKSSALSAVFQRASLKKREYSAYADEKEAFIQAPTSTSPKGRPPLYAVIFAVSRWELLLSAVVRLAGIALSLVPPLTLGYLLVFIEDGEVGWHGYVYALEYTLSQFVCGLLNAHDKYFMALGAYKAQSALVSALYKKVLRISSSSRRKYTAGHITNLISVDVEQVGQFLQLANSCWSVPLKIVATLALLWHYLGPSCMATVATMSIGTLATTCAAHYCGKFQKQQMTFKDLRLRLTNEILNGIKVIKLNAWEPPFIEKVEKVRTKELSSLRKYSLLQSAFGFIWAITPFAALLASFGAFLFVNPANQLSPSLAFTCLSLFMLLRLPVYILPEVVSRFIKCRVSLKRLSEFLDEADLKEDMVGGIPEEGAAVTLSQATFTWSKEDPPVLKDVNLNVKAGSLVAVVGSVGSGKSSLLSAVLGALEKVSGSVDVQGRIAYVAQQSWIQNATLKENIIFTNSVDQDRYREVVEACALGPDLDMLPGGDNTQVGDKGFNLSGGQKLRISLARAVFHDADVYLLDDPFSAVDIHVASHLFDHVVGPSGILKSKTRILMTHSVSFLSQADWIVFLENGRVKEQGTYNDLLAGIESGFCSFLRDHVKRSISNKAMDSTEESTDVGCNDEVKKNGVPAGCRVADDEKVNNGNVGWHIYREYPKRVGWKFLLPSILTTYVAYGCKYGSSLWLSLWSTDPDPAHKHGYILGYGMILVVMCVFNLVHWVIFLFGSLRAAASFHDQLLQSVMRSPISFFDTTPMGRVINRFSRDIDLVDKDVPFYAAMNMANIASMSLLVVVLCIPSAYFVFIVVVTSVLFLGLMVVSLPSFRQVRRLQSVSRSPVLSHFGETISGAISIRAFGATEHFVKTLEYLQDNSINCHIHAASLDGCRMVLVQLLTSLLSLGAALVTVLVRHSLDPGMVGMVLSYTLQMADEVSLVGLMSVMLTASLVAVERVMEYFNLPQEAPWRNAKVQPAAGWPTLGEVTFSDYSAAYRNGDKPVLRHINFKSRGGQKVGVVGRTGAGKSTCALALFRVVEPKSGSIVVDDVDVTEIGLHDLRLKMTIIPQDPVLFAGTLRWNLDPFNEHPDEALWKALEQAHLKDFISSQESGLDCDIAEGGDNLSAGQRQLVCLARALLRQSKVLVLDEATSSVDLKTERLLKETTRAEFQSTTVITIAHKLHTVMDCDQILVLSGGEIVEQGSPADLLKIKDGLFFKMARDAGLT